GRRPAATTPGRSGRRQGSETGRGSTSPPTHTHVPPTARGRRARSPRASRDRIRASRPCRAHRPSGPSNRFGRLTLGEEKLMCQDRSTRRLESPPGSRIPFSARIISSPPAKFGGAMSASDEIELQVPNLRYDITMPFVDGRVPVDGVRLKVGRGVAGTVLPKDSPLITGDFGLVDLNIGNLLQAIEAGWEMVALPVFSKRKPVYTYVFCRSDRGIATPKDLEGKRIGAGRYVSSITVWLRGLLHEHYGV